MYKPPRPSCAEVVEVGGTLGWVGVIIQNKLTIKETHALNLFPPHRITILIITIKQIVVFFFKCYAVFVVFPIEPF